MKSNVSDLLELMHMIYRDACAKCIADVSDLRDLETIRSRVNDEGLSFLTITLPAFAADLEECLAQCCVDPKLFRRFRKVGRIPAFLQGFTSLIFNRETGRINDEIPLSDYHSTIVDCIRQICLAFKKVEVDCTPARTYKALKGFTLIEHEFEKFSLRPDDHDYFNHVSRVLWGNAFSDFDHGALVPHHGPGATADKRSGNQKYVWRTWHERLEPYFPLIDNGYSVSVVDDEVFNIVTVVPENSEQPVRVVTVPKTLKSPRIIAVEPCVMQYAQQPLKDFLYSRIESHWLSAGHVNFRDQSINGSLALKASKDGQLATIDLSEASDRVPRELALEMFQTCPDLRDAIDACRSMRAELPWGEIITLKKFASMGSALCFPVESMYFYTICVGTLLREYNLPVTERNIFKVSRSVYVYGDDIIVPSTNAIAILADLQKYNCKINDRKTFYTGRFRESCGVDAYNGDLVTPVYVRTLQPENRQQAREIISWVKTANLFYKKGYWSTARHIFTCVERVTGSLPVVHETSPALGRISFLGHYSVERWNSDIHTFEIKAWVPTPVYRTDRLDGYPALQKCLINLTRRLSATSVEVSDKHLEESALHGAVTLKRRWVPPS